MKKIMITLVVVLAVNCTSTHAGGVSFPKKPPIQEAELSIMEQIKAFFGFEV